MLAGKAPNVRDYPIDTPSLTLSLRPTLAYLHSVADMFCLHQPLFLYTLLIIATQSPISQVKSDAVLWRINSAFESWQFRVQDCWRLFKTVVVASEENTNPLNNRIQRNSAPIASG